MFNDKYGLTQAVLEGRKTQTRRIATIQPPYKNSEIAFPTSFLLSDEPEKHPLWLAYCWVNKDNDKEYTDWIKPKFKRWKSLPSHKAINTCLMELYGTIVWSLKVLNQQNFRLEQQDVCQGRLYASPHPHQQSKNTEIAGYI